MKDLLNLGRTHILRDSRCTGFGEYVELPQGRFVEGIVRLHTEQVILFYRTIAQFKCRYRECCADEMGLDSPSMAVAWQNLATFESPAT